MDLSSRRPSEPGVTVVIPARNEAGRITATVAAARALPGVRQVIVVDDGSDDDTATRASQAGAAVMRLERHVGKGGAVRAGVRAATEGIVLLLDADLGASAAEAVKLIAPVASGRADMTVAVFPRLRHRGGFGFAVGVARLAIRALTWRRMEAPLSGQRAVRRSLLQQLRLAGGFGLEVGLTLDALALGARLLEVPVEMTHAATGRSLAGFRHRGKQFLSVLAVALPRLLWPLGPTGRPAGRARMVAAAVGVFACVMAVGWTAAALDWWASEAVVAVAFAWCAVVGALAIADRLGWRRENYQGRRVLSSVGICFALVSVPYLVLEFLDWPNLHPHELIPLGLALVMGGVGLLDDLRGSREVRGFAGHFRALTEGRITTGLVKVVVGGGACLAAGVLLTLWRTWQWTVWPGLLDGVLIALCANSINLLDLRPGRALKGFWALCLPAVVLPRWALATAPAFIEYHLLYVGPVEVLFLCSLIYAPLDFRARAMMGDAGSNVLGAVAGLALVEALPIEGRIALVAVLVAVHVYAEFGSLSALIERNRALRWLDMLGRSDQAPLAPAYMSSPSMGEE